MLSVEYRSYNGPSNYPIWKQIAQNTARDIEKQANAGNELAAVANDVLCYSIKKYIGAYTFAMGGLDAAVFTAGIGENSATIRGKTLCGLEDLGVVLDAEKNAPRSGEARLISAESSKVKVFVIPTDEELVIAQDTLALVKP